MRDEYWYALYTRHQHEKTVADMLSAKGFEVFLPLYSAARQWTDRVKRLSVPLFPCYVFIRTSLDRRLPIVTTPGVYAFVGVEGRAARIPDAEIDAVHRTMDNLLRVEPHPFLRSGDWVRVKSGPLEGIEGILVRKTNRFRLVLSVEMLEKSVAVEVDPSVVERSHSRGAGHHRPIANTGNPLASREGLAGRPGMTESRMATPGKPESLSERDQQL